MTVSDESVPPPEEARGDRPRPETNLNGPLPDDLEHWTLPEDFVLDEDFVRAGVHEPPARTRIAIARHDAELARQAQVRVRPAAPRTSRTAKVDWPEETTAEVRPARTHSRWRQVVAVLVAFSLLCATVLGRFLPNTAGADYSVGARLTNDATKTIHGIAAADPAGTCYSIADRTTSDIDLASAPCSQPHFYELVSRATAADFPTYPDDDYWATYVSPVCYQAILSYLGKARADWPVGLSAGFFRPSAASWAQGDRAVECVTASRPSSVGSVYGS